MEMANDDEVAGAFLEAHFYDNGLRHVAFPQLKVRPSWAPPSERAGIKNADLKMKPGMVVVEYSRIASEESEADWLGVFWPSEDQQLGNRGNYAGIGLWSEGYRYSSCSDLVDALGKISSQVAQLKGVPEKLGSNILAFMQDYLPSHLEDDAGLPPGIRPIQAAGRIAKTKVEAITFPIGGATSLPIEVCNSVANRVMIANLTRDPDSEFSRLLIVIANDHAKIREGGVSPLHEVPDLTSHILKRVGAQSIENRQKAEGLARDNAQMIKQIETLEAQAAEAKKNEDSLLADIADLRELNRHLEAEHALPPDLIRRLDRIENTLPAVSSLSDVIQRRFNTLEERIAKISRSGTADPYKNNDLRQRHISLNTQTSETFWESWGIVVLIAIIFVGFTVAAYFLYPLIF